MIFLLIQLAFAVSYAAFDYLCLTQTDLIGAPVTKLDFPLNNMLMLNSSSILTNNYRVQ